MPITHKIALIAPVAGLTPFSLVASDVNKKLDSVTLGAGLDYGSGGILSLILSEIDHDSLLNVHQDVNTDASPLFAGLTLTGNITIPDGGTIGQAAGPLLTFDDTDNELDITGCKQINYVRTGVGAANNAFLILSSENAAQIQLAQYIDAVSGGSFVFKKSRGTTAVPTIASNGDKAGGFFFEAYDGAVFRELGLIMSTVDGVPSAGDMPGSLIFYTTQIGTMTRTERIRVDSVGLVTIAGALTVSGITTLGSLAGILKGTAGVVSGGAAHADLASIDTNQHIDHTTVSITAGTGMSGGGTIAANRTLDCTITQYTDALARTACIASSISDGDLTHSPDGNSVFDALALKAPLASPSFTTPTLGAASATSISIDGHVLDSNEWHYLDGQNQAVTTAARPSFAGQTLTGTGNLLSLGVTAESWHPGSVNLQLGLSGSIMSGLGSVSLNLLANAYESSVDGNWKYISSNFATQIAEYNGCLYYLDAPSGTADNNITWSIRFAISQGGLVGLGGVISDTTTMAGSTLTIKSASVGIGVIDPLAKLHLSGGETSTGFTAATVALGYGTTGNYPHFIHTRHDGAGFESCIDFYTNDGTNAGVYPTNAVHGMTIRNGKVGVGLVTPLAKLHVDQSSTTGAIPVLTLDQGDVSEEFIRFIGTAADNVITQSIVAAADVGTATIAGYVKVYVQDDGNQITDQAYYVPIYSLAAP
jgi:hypothetical protein